MIIRGIRDENTIFTFKILLVKFQNNTPYNYTDVRKYIFPFIISRNFTICIHIYILLLLYIQFPILLKIVFSQIHSSLINSHDLYIIFD